MSIQEIIVLGSWLFAIATVITRDVAGWFMIFSWIMAIVVSACFLT